MSASRLTHERNMRAKAAREQERRVKAREGQGYEPRQERLVRRVFLYMTRGRR